MDPTSFLGIPFKQRGKKLHSLLRHNFGRNDFLSLFCEIKAETVEELRGEGKRKFHSLLDN